MNRLEKWVLTVSLVLAGLFVAVYGGADLYRSVEAARLEDGPVTVVIDAGHGGEDGGATAADGTLESMLNLEIALRVRDLLTFCGVDTRMIRETDAALYSEGCNTLSEKKVSDLKNRVELVNGTPNALLLSIHQNTFPEQKYRGAQVFYAKNEDSRVLAQSLQTALREGVDPKNHREANPSQSVYLMEHIHCTGVLVECGFLSNPQEAKALREDSYQKKLTAAICQALVVHVSREEEQHEV